MTTSGTYNFNPSLGEVTIYALGMCGIRGTAILQEHMETARMASNMMLGRWSSDGVNLWAVDLQTVPLVAGQATYTVPPSTVAMLDAYFTAGGTNRVMLPISRTEYASYPNPNQTGTPTVFWFDRLLSPTVTLWYVPDGSQTSFSYYRVRQIQDSEFSNGQSVEIPYYFWEAFAFGLAARLAMTYAVPRVMMLKSAADEAYGIAARQNEENASTYITPMISSYFRV